VNLHITAPGYQERSCSSDNLSGSEKTRFIKDLQPSTTALVHSISITVKLEPKAEDQKTDDKLLKELVDFINRRDETGTEGDRHLQMDIEKSYFEYIFARYPSGPSSPEVLGFVSGDKFGAAELYKCLKEILNESPQGPGVTSAQNWMNALLLAGA
jgi:hypothetical protein